MSCKDFSLGPIFPQIFLKKFGSGPFLKIPSGFICNKQAYLDLSDLDMLNDLGHILDFYRELDFEGLSLSIQVGYKYAPLYCTCPCSSCEQTSFCYTCDLYTCKKCIQSHSEHKIQTLSNLEYTPIPMLTCICCGVPNNYPFVYYHEVETIEGSRTVTMLCLDCLNHVPHDPEYIQMVHPVINFNIAEWIPIQGFLENRNIDSKLYGRKIRYEFSSLTKFRLIHYKVPYKFDYESTLKADAICRICKNIPDVLIDKILDYVGNFQTTGKDIHKMLPVVISVRDRP